RVAVTDLTVGPDLFCAARAKGARRSRIAPCPRASVTTAARLPPAPYDHVRLDPLTPVPLRDVPQSRRPRVGEVGGARTEVRAGAGRVSDPRRRRHAGRAAAEIVVGG